MLPRPLTERERSVLSALLSMHFLGNGALRRQARTVTVVGTRGCGCPSIDFEPGRGLGMTVRVHARGRESPGAGGLYLYTIDDPRRGEVLGGIDWLGDDDQTWPSELPEPQVLEVRVDPVAMDRSTDASSKGAP